MEAQLKRSNEKPTAVESIFTITTVGDEKYIFCPIRKRAYSVNSKPEELVRQSWLYKLRDEYGYQWNQISVEVPVLVGSTEAKKAADIVVYTDSKKQSARVFIEIKKPNRLDGLEQLKVYMNATGCRLGMWANGSDPNVYLLRIEPTDHTETVEWRELRNIPTQNETLTDVDNPITRADLSPVEDMLSIVKDCENYIKAHEGSDAFDEIFKLIFAKLFDERRNLKNDASAAQFRVGALEPADIARLRITTLYKQAKERWPGVFKPGEELLLGDLALAYCVSALQRTYLLKSDVDVLGAAFEVMINPSMKGDKGQYFTPRHVVDLCVEILNPKENESVLDPACGSGGFLVGAMDHVFKTIARERDDQNEILENQKDYASESVYGIDYDPLIAKVAKAYMLIWGDGRSNICIADGLSEKNWNEHSKDRLLVDDEYGNKKLKQFDVIMMNPPFAGSVHSVEILSQYELAYSLDKKGKRKRAKSVSRDILFLERAIHYLRPGGRMAVVVPRGLLKNYTDEPVRRFLLKYSSIRAVISLSGSMFKPFTNTKTCVIFLQKRLEPLGDLEESQNDADVVYAVTQRPGKDRSGKVVRLADGTIDSDLPEIGDYVLKNIEWEK